jgi:hypothetical protein
MTHNVAVPLASEVALEGVFAAAGDRPAFKEAFDLPAEIVLEILTLLAQHGQMDAHNALYVSKAFYPTLAKHHHFKIRWRNLKGFQSILKKHRKTFVKVTIDLRVNAEDETGVEPAYRMGNLLEDLSQIDFQAKEVAFLDLYTRLYAYAVPLDEAFASSIKSLTCIESGSLTHSEETLVEELRAEELRAMGFTCSLAIQERKATLPFIPVAFLRAQSSGGK